MPEGEESHFRRRKNGSEVIQAEEWSLWMGEGGGNLCISLERRGKARPALARGC